MTTLRDKSWDPHLAGVETEAPGKEAECASDLPDVSGPSPLSFLGALPQGSALKPTSLEASGHNIWAVGMGLGVGKESLLCVTKGSDDAGGT
jgi:hypothetical protein